SSIRARSTSGRPGSTRSSNSMPLIASASSTRHAPWPLYTTSAAISAADAPTLYTTGVPSARSAPPTALYTASNGWPRVRPYWRASAPIACSGGRGGSGGCGRCDGCGECGCGVDRLGRGDLLHDLLVDHLQILNSRAWLGRQAIDGEADAVQP